MIHEEGPYTPPQGLPVRVGDKIRISEASTRYPGEYGTIAEICGPDAEHEYQVELDREDTEEYGATGFDGADLLLEEPAA